jgi:mannose-6-phosphate isomerase-like protein (cupin superfamily)
MKRWERMQMQIVDHNRQPLEEWRPGVTTRMRVSAVTGTMQLCLFEQFCEPGRGAPTHLHAVEEVLTVLDGTAEIWLDDERGTLTTGQSIVVPAGQRHGFRNVGQTTLHVQATLAAPIFEASFDDRHEVQRRWLPPRRQAVLPARAP